MEELRKFLNAQMNLGIPAELKIPPAPWPTFGISVGKKEDRQPTVDEPPEKKNGNLFNNNKRKLSLLRPKARRAEEILYA